MVGVIIVTWMDVVSFFSTDADVSIVNNFTDILRESINRILATQEETANRIDLLTAGTSEVSY